MKIAIIGYRHVGKAMHNLFKDAFIYDPNLGLGTKEGSNKCDISFVCVPTPEGENGLCDTSIVRDVVNWLETPVIVLRSTVYVGFTDEISNETGKNIIFQPEYYSETKAHPFSDLSSRTWLSFGGKKEAIDYAIKAYQEVYNSEVKIFISDAKTVEFAKYMENSYLATKVTFCNEIYDIASSMGINYNEAREIWLADPRIGRSHTFVYEESRGYGGKCLPKDIRSLIAQAKNNNINVSFLKNVELANFKFTKHN